MKNRPFALRSGAYAAAAKGNQQRVSQTLASVQDDPFLPDDLRETIATAVTALGNTSSREKAQGIVADVLSRLGDEHQELGRSLLNPLAEQIKR